MQGLPMTIRSAYFPLFGHAVYGFTGDAIDALAICTTLVAICTSMASGAIQITTGISMLNPAIPRSTFIHIILVIAMTLMASISAHAGLRHGVRILSIVSFMIMLSMLIMVGLVDDTVYLLNVLVQSLGHHIQWYMQLGFHTDAFEQLEGSVDGKSGPPVRTLRTCCHAPHFPA
jgi:choline-glycine betaine transporter